MRLPEPCRKPTEIAEIIVRLLAEYRQWTDADLKKVLQDPVDDADEKLSSRRLRASLGLLPVDLRQADYLYNRALAAEPEEVTVLPGNAADGTRTAAFTLASSIPVQVVQHRCFKQ